MLLVVALLLWTAIIKLPKQPLSLVVSLVAPSDASTGQLTVI